MIDLSTLVNRAIALRMEIEGSGSSTYNGNEELMLYTERLVFWLHIHEFIWTFHLICTDHQHALIATLGWHRMY